MPNSMPLKATPQNQAIDPVCGRTVDKDTEFVLTQGHKKYYFCSAKCKFRFLAAQEGKSERAPKASDFKIRTGG